MLNPDRQLSKDPAPARQQRSGTVLPQLSAISIELEHRRPFELAAPAGPWSRPATLAAIVVWGLVIATGSAYNIQYERTAAKAGIAKDRWPKAHLCTLSPDRPTLVMFVHPRCPCSRASLNELALLMTHCQGRVESQVVFFQPSSAPFDWAKTDLWESAANIPGVFPMVDLDGAEQRRFGARVSGEAFLYRSNGELSFHGGITGGRGHEGDNPGRLAVEAFLHGQGLPGDTTPVFGCELESYRVNPRDCRFATEGRVGR